MTRGTRVIVVIAAMGVAAVVLGAARQPVRAAGDRASARPLAFPPRSVN